MVQQRRRHGLKAAVSRAGLERSYQAPAELPRGPMDLSKVKGIMDDFGIVLHVQPGKR